MAGVLLPIACTPIGEHIIGQQRHNPAQRESGLDSQSVEAGSVSLNCANRMVTLTCTRFSSNGCIKSQITFFTERGKRIVDGKKHVPQNFVNSIVTAKSLSCVRTSDRVYLSVLYNSLPAYAENTYVRYYDLTGRLADSHFDSNHDILEAYASTASLDDQYQR